MANALLDTAPGAGRFCSLWTAAQEDELTEGTRGAPTSATGEVTLDIPDIATNG